MTHQTEQDFIDAVHQEVLKYHKDAIGYVLSEEIRALARVTYRFLKALEWRVNSIGGKDAE